MELILNGSELNQNQAKWLIEHKYYNPQNNLSYELLKDFADNGSIILGVGLGFFSEAFYKFSITEIEASHFLMLEGEKFNHKKHYRLSGREQEDNAYLSLLNGDVAIVSKSFITDDVRTFKTQQDYDKAFPRSMWNGNLP